MGEGPGGRWDPQGTMFWDSQGGPKKTEPPDPQPQGLRVCGDGPARGRGATDDCRRCRWP